MGFHQEVSWYQTGEGFTGVGLFYWCGSGFVLLGSFGIPGAQPRDDPVSWSRGATTNGLDWRNPTQLRFFWDLGSLEQSFPSETRGRGRGAVPGLVQRCSRATEHPERSRPLWDGKRHEQLHSHPFSLTKPQNVLTL